MINKFKSPSDYKNVFEFLEKWRYDLIDFVKMSKEEQETTSDIEKHSDILSGINYATDELDQVISAMHSVRLSFLNEIYKELENPPV